MASRFIRRIERLERSVKSCGAGQAAVDGDRLRAILDLVDLGPDGGRLAEAYATRRIPERFDQTVPKEDDPEMRREVERQFAEAEREIDQFGIEGALQRRREKTRLFVIRAQSHPDYLQALRLAIHVSSGFADAKGNLERSFPGMTLADLWKLIRTKRAEIETEIARSC